MELKAGIKGEATVAVTESNTAASMGSTAFFAPSTHIWPFSGLEPAITKRPAMMHLPKTFPCYPMRQG